MTSGQKVICIIILLIVCPLLRAQPPRPAVLQAIHPYYKNDYIVQNLGTENGLSYGLTTFVFCDSKGFIWIGTDQGLNMYDGSRFKVFHRGTKPDQLSGERCFYITEARNGDIWLVNYTSIDVYNRQSNQFTKYPFVDTKGNRKVIVRTVFLAPDNRVWVFTSQGLYFLDTSTGIYHPYTSVLPANRRLAASVHYNGVAFDSTQQQLWIGGYAGIACYDFKTNRLFDRDHNPGNWPVFSHSTYQSAMVMAPGRKLFFVDNARQAVVGYDLQGHRARLYSLPDVYKKTLDIFALHAPPDGSVWIGIRDEGLFKLDTIAGTYTGFQRNQSVNSIRKNYIWSITHDYQQNIWACNGEGLSVISRRPYSFNTYFGPEIISEISRKSRIYSVFVDKDSAIWAPATEAHLMKYEPGKQVYRQYRLPVAGSVLKVMAYASDTLLVLTSEGLWFFNSMREKFSRVHFEKGNELLRDASFLEYGIALPGGDYYLSTRKGVLRVNFNSKTVKLYSSSFFDPGFMAEKRLRGFTSAEPGTCFLSFELDSLNIYKWELASDRVTPFHEQLPAAARTSSFSPMDLYAGASGHLYVTDFAWGFLDIDTRSLQTRHWTKEDGLPSNAISHFAEDEKGNAWIATAEGLAMLSPAGIITRYGIGYPRLSDYAYATMLDKTTGKLYVSDINYIHEINYRDFAAISPSFQIQVSAIRVNNKLVMDEGPSFFRLPSTSNNIAIEIGTCNYYAFAGTQVLYKLEEQGGDYVQAGGNTINLTNLAPGTYTLLIDAVSYAGSRNLHPIRLQFNVLAPWYRTWWFYGLMAIVFIALLYLLFRYRLRQKIKVLQMRNRISRDLHDEVGASLSGIKLFSQMAEDRFEQEPEISKDYLQKVKRYSEVVLASMNDIVWTINPENDSVDKIIRKLNQYAVSIAGPQAMAVHFHVDKTVQELKPSMQQRKNVYLICKEAINNAVKYSAAKNLYCSFIREKEVVITQVKDDGKGFDQATMTAGNGLENMRQRATEIEAVLAIETSATGTIVTLFSKIT